MSKVSYNYDILKRHKYKIKKDILTDGGIIQQNNSLIGINITKERTGKSTMCTFNNTKIKCKYFVEWLITDGDKFSFIELEDN